jgi:exonuclease III
MPHVTCDGVMHITFHSPPAIERFKDQDCPIWPVQCSGPVSAKSDAVISIALKVASANVLSLRPQRDERGRSDAAVGRESLLKGLFASQGYHVVGLQETRSRVSGLCREDGFIVIASASEKGVGGCELWMSHEEAFAQVDGRDVFWKDQDFTVLHSDPQRLFVRARNKVIKADMLVAHAPFVGCLEDIPSARSWWKQTTVILRDRKNQYPVIAMIDANARVGLETSELVGDRGAENQNLATPLFLQFLVDGQFAVPSTFAEFHRGASTTWTQPRGHKCRIDYVCVPMEWLASVQQTEVDMRIDLDMKQPDHQAVQCS